MRLGVEAALVDGRVVAGDVSVADGRIESVGLAGRGRGIALPGFVDLQVNGFGGVDLLRADTEAVLELGRRLLQQGVTAYQPTLITSPPDETKRALRAIEAARLVGGAGARILGTHLEGPFLSPARAGTHLEELLRQPLAPELPGADALIDELVSRGICVSIGHSAADAAAAHAAFDRGARSVTHLFNAMSQLGPREAGVAGVALVRDDVVLQLIVDGVHLAPEPVLLAWRSGRGRVALVSDSIAAAGCGDGVYTIGGIEVVVADGVARRADGRLAGSARTLADGLRRLVALDIPLEDAVPCVTSIPAGLLGVDAGRLAPGTCADVVVVDDALAVTSVLLEGEPVAEVEV
ncbi:MAG: N-acetylglucosamine-6-phosphate deacetylase [Actinobacteria bacterium]|nr:MAG: N-acetylglucosamine-6-phosphate deacetylase [Actinomycetota bacterium]